MANISAYEYLRKLLHEQAMDSIDGVIVGRSDNLVDVRVQGSSRVLRDICVPAYITYAQTAPGRRCSLGVHAGQAFLLAVFLDPADDSGVYAAQVIDLEVLDITVEAKPDGYHVSWETSPYAAHYELYGDADGDGSDIGLLYSGDEAKYTVPYGQWAYFAVRAVAIDGTNGPLSSWVTDALTPDVPTDVVVQAVAGGFEVAWDLMDKAASYSVEWAEDDQGSNVGTVVSGYHGDQLFVPADGTHKYFRVEAVGYDSSQSGWSSWTNDSDAPGTPAGFSTLDGVSGGFLTVDLATDTSHQATGFRRWQVRIADDDQGTNGSDYGYMLAEEAAGKWVAQAVGTTRYYAIAAEDWGGNVSTYTTFLPLVARSSDYGPVEDSFTTYGDTTVKSGDASIGLYWLQLDGFNAAISFSDWTASEGSVYPDGTGRVEGLSAACLSPGATTYQAIASRTVSWDLSADYRWSEDTDMLTLSIYKGLSGTFSAAAEFKIRFITSSGNYYEKTWSVASLGTYQRQWLTVQKSGFSATGSPSWSNITSIEVAFDNKTGTDLPDAFIDDLRIVKAHPDDSTQFGDAGGNWAFDPDNDPDNAVWHIVPGNVRGYEPLNVDYSLAHMGNSGSDWVTAYMPESNVPGGQYALGFYAGDTADAAMLFNIQDAASSTRTAYAVEMTIGLLFGTVELVKWDNGTRTSIKSVAYNFYDDENEYTWWCGVEWDDDIVKVYISKDRLMMFDVSNLVLSATDTSLTRGGHVGVMSKTELRVVYVRAGSPQHARTAERSFIATQAESALGIQGRPVVATAPSDGQALVWDGTGEQWEPGSAVGAHTHTESDITDLDHDAAKLQGRTLASTAPSTGDVLTWGGSSWAPQDGCGEGVFVYRTSNRTHTSATAIPFNAETRDDASFHNNSTNTTRLTVPAGKAGWYIITGKIGAANSSSITYAQAYIKRNGSVTLAANMSERNTNDGDINAVVAVVFYLSAGDYVELFTNAGGVSSFTLKGDSGEYKTNFGMVRIGA